MRMLKTKARAMKRLPMRPQPKRKVVMKKGEKNLKMKMVMVKLQLTMLAQMSTQQEKFITEKKMRREIQLLIWRFKGNTALKSHQQWKISMEKKLCWKPTEKNSTERRYMSHSTVMKRIPHLLK